MLAGLCVQIQSRPRVGIQELRDHGAMSDTGLRGHKHEQDQEADVDGSLAQQVRSQRLTDCRRGAAHYWLLPTLSAGQYQRMPSIARML